MLIISFRDFGRLSLRQDFLVYCLPHFDLDHLVGKESKNFMGQMDSRNSLSFACFTSRLRCGLLPVKLLLIFL